MTQGKKKRQSIFAKLEQLKLPALGRPLVQRDIEQSVAVAMRENFQAGKPVLKKQVFAEPKR